MPASPGFLFAHFQRFISPTPFSLGASIDYLFMVIIGGAGSLWGAPVGAALVVVLRDQFNDWIPRITGRVGDFELLVFSLVVIVLLQRAPDGLLPLLARLKRRRAPQRDIGIRRACRSTADADEHQPRQARNCWRWRRSPATSAGSPRTATSASPCMPARSSR